MNTLYYGDNLDILRRYVADESIDLVYLDPPFKSDQNYNVLFAEQDGSRSAAQIRAFGDTWQWDQAAAAAYHQIVEAGGKVSEAMQAFRRFLGDNDMLAYLCMMAPRLVELRRVLKDTGSLYLHCDPTASHYLKMLLDAVLGPEQFRNEIIWRRTGSHNSRRSFGPIHDTILFYSKTGSYIFNIVRRPYSRDHVAERYKPDSEGRLRFIRGGNAITGAGTTQGDSCNPWRGFDPAKKGRHWAVPGFFEELMPEEYKSLKPTGKLEALFQAGLMEIVPDREWPIMVRYLDERDGVPVQDIWAYQPYTEKSLYGTDEGIDGDVAWMGPIDPQRLGYQTQKPMGLLERIISASSNKGAIVLDPFCGCGTAIATAQKMDRSWIGIDITCLATSLIKNRLRSTFGEDITKSYEVIGEPVSANDAATLADADPYQFQWWALGLVGARPVEQKKGADKGIDGRLYFHDEGATGKTKQAIFSVKAGHVTVSQVRDLRGVLDREKAEIGVLISMEESTKPMRTEAASAGFYRSPFTGKDHPRLQLLTVGELLAGKAVDMPPIQQTSTTFKKAPKAKPKVTHRQKMLGEDESAEDG